MLIHNKNIKEKKNYLNCRCADNMQLNCSLLFNLQHMQKKSSRSSSPTSTKKVPFYSTLTRLYSGIKYFESTAQEVICFHFFMYILMDSDMKRITRISFMIINILLDKKCKTIIFHTKL